MLLLNFVHERLHGVIQRLHEASHVDRGGGPGELGGEALVSVGQHVLVLVMLPRMENVSDIQIVRVVLAALLDNVHHKVCLEVDLLVTVSQLLVPEYPGPPVLVHGLVVRESDLSHEVLGQPQTNNVKHGVGVVLVLKTRVYNIYKVVNKIIPGPLRRKVCHCLPPSRPYPCTGLVDTEHSWTSVSVHP